MAAFSSAANRTNRNRDQASIAQNTCSRLVLPQSITSASPGEQTAGRRLERGLKHDADLANRYQHWLSQKTASRGPGTALCNPLS